MATFIGTDADETITPTLVSPTVTRDPAGAFPSGDADTLHGGGGNDTLDGGDGDDKLYSGSGTDSLDGSGGDDRFVFGATFGTDDLVAGGGGSDTLVLEGNYSSLLFAATTMTGVETIRLAAGFSYTLTTNDATITGGVTLTIEAGHLKAGEVLNFDGSAEDDDGDRVVITAGRGDDTVGGGAGRDNIRGGNGQDTLIGYSNNDFLFGGRGADLLILDSGVDRVGYDDVLESTSRHYDTIVAFNGKTEHFVLPVGVTGIDAVIASGRLGEANLNDHFAAAAAASRLLANHAVLFTPDRGAHAGETFLIVDANGTAGYQAREDFVFRLDNATNLGNISTSTFT